MADFYIGQNDLPLWTETLLDENGAPVNINGTTVTMSMVPAKGGTDVITGGGVVVNDDDGTPANRGKVHRQMLTGETATPGDYLVRVVATGAGHPISFPNTGFFVWMISPTAVAQQRRYVGIEEFKKTLSLSNTTYVDYDADIAIEAASRGVEDAFGGPWTLGAPGEVRYYTRATPREVSLGDVVSISSVDLDYSLDDVYLAEGELDYPFAGGGGTYSTNLPSSSYTLRPVNPKHGLAAAGGNGEPYRSLMLNRGAVVRRFPRGTDAIKVTGQFGWEAVPSGVKWTVQLVAARMMKRTRDAPFGIVSFGADDRAIAVRQIVNDPDIVTAMRGVSGRKRLLV